MIAITDTLLPSALYPLAKPLTSNRMIGNWLRFFKSPFVSHSDSATEDYRVGCRACLRPKSATRISRLTP